MEAVTQPNKDIDIKLEEILPRLGRQLQDKLMYSINLLRKAEKLALHYDPENGFYNTFSGGKDSQARSTRTCEGTGFRQSKGSCGRGALRRLSLRYWRYARPQRNRRWRK